jgi:hypothetical protein
MRRGWRGPEYEGEFPTLGQLVGEWIEEMCIVPDQAQKGQPYLLTDEMWDHLFHVYRLHPTAQVHPRRPRPVDGLVHYGTQLRRPQKWGKDPLNAAKVCAHAFGPVQFDGWDAAGEPVGRPVDTPWIQIAATSEDQTDNTYKPFYTMITVGPLADTPGLDPGLTETKLPNGDGWVEPVTMSADSRLGNPITYASFTETHLMTRRNKGKPMIRAMKRNLGGIGGSWSEVTNAWDPSEDSAAQETSQAKAPGVYLDHRFAHLPPLSRAEFADDAIVRERIVIKYGDSVRTDDGGWVDVDHILALVRDAATGEAESRRYYLDEITVGDRDAVDATRWDALARPARLPAGSNPTIVEPVDVDPSRVLAPGERIVLGFDGSRVRDSTALIGVRISDGRWFELGVWNPEDYRTPEQEQYDLPGKVPEATVEQAIEDAIEAYEVWHLIADPYRWQTVLDRLAGKYPRNPAEKPQPLVIEFPTNSERRFDEVVLLFETAFRSGEGEFTHDGSATLRRHALNAAIAQGGPKPAREQVDGRPQTNYLKIVKKRPGWRIDAFIAGLLGTWGRGRAIEEGALVVVDEVEPWAFTS